MSGRNDTDELLSIARLGIDAESFLATPLGRFLMNKATEEQDAAMEELVNADPEDAKLNRELRNRIHVVRMFRQWMTDSINAGRQAYQQMKEQEDLERHSGA